MVKSKTAATNQVDIGVVEESSTTSLSLNDMQQRDTSYQPKSNTEKVIARKPVQKTFLLIAYF